ncbi:hypothetical protein [Aliidiomarina soli]|uniref:Uncharacterized protein n=1 Tax=Aliidiomarina soli TaxID=1928574 RepID=A0A432WBW8_9GAMM|nr:hypothetical protein [Aliidiomarina soli]RUO29571.1 hypothetical protein CWE14_14015 [Aliidiomarina soli]
MSYDLMVFEPTAAPKERKEFMAWYAHQIKWTEDHGYQNPTVSSPGLQAWLQEMVEHFPAMNGPLANEDSDDSRVTDYSIGQNVIYSAFSWSVVEEAYPKVRELAIKHSVGFFDVSADNGEIIFPGDGTKEKKPWWKFW